MKNILIATNNMHKIEDFKELFKDTCYNVLSLKDVNIEIEVEETGTTFYENALIKAKAVYEVANMPVISDDSGLCVYSLNLEPGVYSSRYSDGGDLKNIEKLLDNLSNKDDRRAYFACSLVYYDGKNVLSALGKVEGEIVHEIKGVHGFGYDPVFYSYELGKTFGEATIEEKNNVSHRKRAMEILIKELV